MKRWALFAVKFVQNHSCDKSLIEQVAVWMKDLGFPTPTPCAATMWVIGFVSNIFGEGGIKDSSNKHQHYTVIHTQLGHKLLFFLFWIFQSDNIYGRSNKLCFILLETKVSWDEYMLHSL